MPTSWGPTGEELIGVLSFEFQENVDVDGTGSDEDRVTPIRVEDLGLMEDEDDIADSSDEDVGDVELLDQCEALALADEYRSGTLAWGPISYTDKEPFHSPYYSPKKRQRDE